MTHLSRRWTVRAIRWLISLTMVSSALSACGSGTESTPEATMTADANALFGYRTESEIGVVRGDTVAVRVPGYFRAPQFTSDRKFLFTTSLKSTGNLVAIDVNNNKVDTRALPSGATAASSGSSIIWWQEPDQLMTIDLSNPASTPSVKRRINLPAAPEGTHARLIAAHGDTVLLARLERTGGTAMGPDNLYLARDGAVTPLGITGGDEPTREAAVSPDGRFIAYPISHRQCGHAQVAVIDVQKATTQTFSLPGDADTGTSTGVLWLWWASDNTVRASFTSRSCFSPSTLTEPFKDPAIWALNNGSWQQEKQGVYQKLAISPTVTALLEPTESGGVTLVVQSGNTKTTITNKVQYLVAP